MLPLVETSSWVFSALTPKRNPEAGVSRTDDSGVWGNGIVLEAKQHGIGVGSGFTVPETDGLFLPHYKAVSAMIGIHLGLMILFKKTGHLKPADIRQSLNIHQDQIRAVIIQTCPCSLRVQNPNQGLSTKNRIFG